MCAVTARLGQNLWSCLYPCCHARNLALQLEAVRYWKAGYIDWILNWVEASIHAIEQQNLKVLKLHPWIRFTRSPGCNCPIWPWFFIQSLTHLRLEHYQASKRDQSYLSNIPPTRTAFVATVQSLKHEQAQQNKTSKHWSISLDVPSLFEHCGFST